MRLQELWATYSYSLVGLTWGIVLMLALGFGLISEIRHILWIQTMKQHAMVPLWLWTALTASVVTLFLFWYRIASAALAYRQQQTQLKEVIVPILRPFPGSVPTGLERSAEWYLAADQHERYAFTWGLRRHRIVVSQALWDQLDAKSQTAVLYHEAAHAQAHDPLQQMILHVLSDALRPLGMGSLYRRYLVLREVRADRMAVVASGGDDIPLLTALSTAMGSGPAVSSYVGLAESLDARIQFLETGRPLSWSDSALRFRLYAWATGLILTVGEGFLMWCHW